MSQTKEPTDALSVVTREAMQLREDLADVAKQRDDAIDDAIRLMRERNEANERVTDATALLERCLHGGLCSAHTRNEVVAWLASRTAVAVAPSQPAHAKGEAKAPETTERWEICLECNELKRERNETMAILAQCQRDLVADPWRFRCETALQLMKDDIYEGARAVLESHEDLAPTAPALRSCTPAERAVLDACADAPESELRLILSLGGHPSWEMTLARAELALRNTP